MPSTHSPAHLLALTTQAFSRLADTEVTQWQSDRRVPNETFTHRLSPHLAYSFSVNNSEIGSGKYSLAVEQYGKRTSIPVRFGDNLFRKFETLNQEISAVRKEQLDTVKHLVSKGELPTCIESVRSFRIANVGTGQLFEGAISDSLGHRFTVRGDVSPDPRSTRRAFELEVTVSPTFGRSITMKWSLPESQAKPLIEEMKKLEK